MFRTFRIPLTWRELVTRTIKDASEDNALGLAAQLSYYFLLALVPAIVCVVALASFLPPQSIQDVIIALRRVAPGDVIDIVRDQLTALAGDRTRACSRLASSSRCGAARRRWSPLPMSLNRAYDIEEARPWWKVRLTAMALTIGVAVFIVVALALVLIGPTVVDRLASPSVPAPPSPRCGDRSVAVCVCPGGARLGTRLLLRAGCGAGLGVGDAGRRAGARCCG